MPAAPFPEAPITAQPPVRLRTDDLADPLGLDNPRPILSWWADPTGPVLRPAAYQIQAATSEAHLTAGTADLWDTGRTETGPDIPRRALAAVYGGPAPAARQAVHWRVRIWDEDPATPPTAWSGPARWEAGLPTAADWAGAQWITAPEWLETPADEAHHPPLPVLTRTFHLDRPVARARLTATALGLYEPAVNGIPLDDALLEPGYTDYATRLLCATHDVTDALRAGPNTLRFLLGTGAAHLTDLPDRYQKFLGSYGTPRLLAVLHIDHPDGTTTAVPTAPGDWLTAPGPVTRSCWFGGEDHDARREHPASWTPAVTTAPPAPGVLLSARAHPPIRHTETLTPVAVTRPRPGIAVFDLGANIAGRFELRIPGAPALPAGRTVTVRPAELLADDGTVGHDPHEVRPVFDRYTSDGRPAVWHPRFTYHGFRYLQVEGLPEQAGHGHIRGQVLHTDAAPAGSFDCSDPLLSAVHRITDRAVRSNLFSVLTDCPHREKLGWLEEAHLLFDTVTRGYDTAALYRKIVQDMADAQTEAGLVPDIAPEFTVFADGFRDDPNWGGALLLVPWHLHRATGETGILERHYPAMLRYLDHLASRSPDPDALTLDHGLGDWITLDDSTPRSLVATAAHLRLLRTAARIAEVLELPTDARRFTTRATATAAAFNTAYLDKEHATYGSGSQACDALSLDLGVVPDDLAASVLDHLVTGIRKVGNRFTVGEIALPALLRVLHRAGRDDILMDVIADPSAPGYAYQVEHGATALTEQWDGPTSGGSLNHFMLGAAATWFTAGLAGIDQSEDSTAWHTITIRPAAVPNLTWTRAHHDTVRGRVATEWRRDDTGGIRLDVTIPPGPDALVTPPRPAGSGTTRGRVLAPPGANPLNAAGTTFITPPGCWTFWTLPKGSGSETGAVSR